MNPNDPIPVTPSMERYTIQANAYSAALDLLPKHCLPDSNVTTSATFVMFVNEWMKRNDHDELGNYPDLVEYAVIERTYRLTSY